jgi:O-antigen ligase
MLVLNTAMIKTDQLLTIYAPRPRITVLAWIIGILGSLFSQAVCVFFIVLEPELGLFLVPYLLLVLIGVVIFRVAVPQTPFWIRLLNIVVLGDFILNWGFSNLTVGIGSARVTLCELILMGCLSWIAMRNWSALWISGFSALLLLGYAVLPLLLHLPVDLSKFGIPAARDALPLVDSLFFFTGVSVVGFARDAERWQAWRHRFLWLLLVGALLYLPTFPFEKTMLAISPMVPGYQMAVPLIGGYASSNVLALAGLLALILMPGQLVWRVGSSTPRWLTYIAFMIFAFAVVALQSRTTYVVAVVSVALLAISGHGLAVRRLVLAALGIIIALAMVEVSGLELKGRVGNIGLEMVVDQLESVGGKSGHEGGRSGVSQRQHWWAYSLSRWASMPETIIAGIGFGEVLTDFSVAGTDGRPVLVREPHNSYISVLTRTGLMGLIPWVLFQLNLMVNVWKRVQSERKNQKANEANYWLWMFLLFMSILITAFVEPVFESPHFAVPYFFLAGLCLGEIARDKNGWVGIIKLNKKVGHV